MCDLVEKLNAIFKPGDQLPLVVHVGFNVYPLYLTRWVYYASNYHGTSGHTQSLVEASSTIEIDIVYPVHLCVIEKCRTLYQYINIGGLYFGPVDNIPQTAVKGWIDKVEEHKANETIFINTYTVIFPKDICKLIYALVPIFDLSDNYLLSD